MLSFPFPFFFHFLFTVNGRIISQAETVVKAGSMLQEAHYNSIVSTYIQTRLTQIQHAPFWLQDYVTHGQIILTLNVHISILLCFYIFIFCVFLCCIYLASFQQTYISNIWHLNFFFYQLLHQNMFNQFNNNATGILVWIKPSLYDNILISGEYTPPPQTYMILMSMFFCL